MWQQSKYSCFVLNGISLCNDCSEMMVFNLQIKLDFAK
jgi:hypothetical protein